MREPPSGQYCASYERKSNKYRNETARHLGAFWRQYGLVFGMCVSGIIQLRRMSIGALGEFCE
jgi:hypothetical protein